MYHKMKKESSYLRASVFESYKRKCSYCGRTLQQRDMHIDHIIPSNIGKSNDDEFNQYICELERDGFEVDSIENYLPSCPACNILKNNKIYAVSNLRFYHELARSHVEDILERIDKLKVCSVEENFYEPINSEMWERLDFSYQRDLSHAIMGYRLTPADVEACPRLTQVEQIKKQLSIVDYVVIEGDTGCGKSISIYQAAFDFYKEGWKVYSCKITDNEINLVIPFNSELSLYIIDDAQRFSENIVENIKMQAKPNIKIIFGKTTSSKVNYDTILITNQDAVKLLYCDFLHKKKEITTIVHKYDENVGLNYLDCPIERRLEAAKKAKTPWQFNYIVRGGWESMREQYKAVCMHNNRDLLVAAIAVFQIVKLDNNVDYKRLCEKLHDYDSMLLWNDSDLKYLVDRKIVLSEEDVRIVHMESAKVIIALFLKDSTDEKKKILRKIVEDSFVSGHTVALGIVWLVNGISSYSNFFHTEKQFISQIMIDYAMNSLSNIDSVEKRLGLTYFIEKVFNSDYEKNGKYYFNQNQDVFLEWIETANSESAYSYSCLLNALHNDDRKRYKKFVEKLDWNKLQKSFLKEGEPNLYAWGSLFNRMICFFKMEKYLQFGTFLEKSIDKVVEKAMVTNIEDVSSFFCSIVYTNPDYIHAAIEKLLPLYKSYFEHDMFKAISIFDFEFLFYICGMSLLGGHRATNVEKVSAQKIVSILPEKKFADMISNGGPREWHDSYHVMCLIIQYDIEKAKRIIEQVDLTVLSKNAKNFWTQSHSMTELCHIIYGVNHRKARLQNEKEITTMYSSLVMIAPKCAIRVFKSGRTIDLLTERWWDASLYALVGLYKADKEVAREILMNNLPRIIERMNNITALDFDENYCLKFLCLIKEKERVIFQTIIEKLDKEKILKNWDRGAIRSRKKKIVEKRKREFFELIKLKE